jgi:hypothetical protein
VADFARYLPLSQRPRVDERGVTSDRREPTATVLRSIAAALRGASDDAWTAHADDDPTTVADAVSGLVAGFDRAPARRALESAQQALGMGGRTPSAEAQPEGPSDAAAALEARAVAITERPQPTRLVELDDAVVAAVRIGDALHSPIAVSPLASGAVALRRAAGAPTPIKAVISGHSLHATDAAWTIGHGPVLVGTAHELIRFLAGIGTQAPRPARPGELGDAADA